MATMPAALAVARQTVRPPLALSISAEHRRVAGEVVLVGGDDDERERAEVDRPRSPARRRAASPASMTSESWPRVMRM